jgi:hypothetical protein
MVLVAATAIGFAWTRSFWDFDTFNGWTEWLGAVPDILVPLLMTSTLATAILHLLPPRPPARRLVLQPGAAACGAIAFTFTTECLRYLVFEFSRNRGIPWYLFRAGSGLGRDLAGGAMGDVEYHYVVAAVWGLLILGRRCHPQPGWLDRAGRAVGLSWLLLALWYSSVYAISEWGRHSR